MSAIIDYRGKTPRKTGSGIPLITARIVKDGRVENPTEFIDPLEYDSWMRRGLPQVGDVVITTEAPLGEIAQLTDDRVALAQRLILLRGKPDILDNTYLKYLMMSAGIQSQLHGRASGTTVLGIKQSELRKIVLSLPPVSEQVAIAGVLSALDDKIEQNWRTGRALERLAWTIFRAWFVDFEPVRAKAAGVTMFPSMPQDIFNSLPATFVESEFGFIPRGWEIKELGDLLDLQYGKPLKAEDRRVGKYPVLGSNGQIGWHDEALVADAGIVVGRKGNPGTVRWVPVAFYPIDTTFYVVRKQHAPPLEVLYYFLGWEQLARLSADSAVPGLNRNFVYRERIVLPQKTIMDSFADTASYLHKLIHSLEYESTKLSGLSSYLLPRLISGKVRVELGHG